MNACRSVRGLTCLGDPGAAGDPPDDPGGAVPVQPPPVRGDKQQAFGALADRQLDRPGGPRGERDGDHRAALAGDDQGAVAAWSRRCVNHGSWRSSSSAGVVRCGHRSPLGPSAAQPPRSRLFLELLQLARGQPLQLMHTLAHD